MHQTSETKTSSKGFTLIEILVVVGIIGVLLGFAVPALTGVLRGNDLARAQQMIESTLAIARQTAIARNRRVEVRFYKFADPSHPVEEDLIRGVQTFLIEENGDAKASSRFNKLPGVVIINSSETLSTALNRSDKAFSTSNPDDPQVSLPGLGTSYSAKAFQFRPDGSTDLESDKDFITIHPARNSVEADATDVGTAAIPDYCVIQVDRISGATTAYRP